MKKIKILCIVGPTASGKSALALELARQLDGEIISCDSMQIYRRMDIGTAKPTQEEMSRIRHHMIDVAEPDESFSCADYVKLAETEIKDCAARGKLPIVCGGTGLYLDSLLRGADFEETAGDEKIREELFAFAEREGAHALHEELCKIDPESAEAIHENNVKRVVRAIEIYRVCGVPKSELDRRSQLLGDRFDATVIGLRYTDREKLYSRIEKRVDIMMSEGLLAETEALLSEGVFEKNHTAAQAIGYKELLAYIAGEEDIDTAVERLKTATRRYAKRQMTWFSAKPYVSWIEADEKTFEEIVNCAKKLFSKA
ncbi:MAG: tRNA (adenosine(37)-N6)-dimethylallyltransferase MiaA [Ruminococcaceae bacterium]|nr:tRNA (adenosine(37)-N6)-dimethylallyltransferase MiaA [Oscillospiraceae bacterium]